MYHRLPRVPDYDGRGAPPAGGPGCCPQAQATAQALQGTVQHAYNSDEIFSQCLFLPTKCLDTRPTGPKGRRSPGPTGRGWRLEAQLEDVEEADRPLFKPLPGMTSVTAPPLIDVTTLGSSAARLSPRQAADQVPKVPPPAGGPICCPHVQATA